MALPEIVRIGLKHRAPVSEDAYRRWLHLSATAAPLSAPPRGPSALHGFARTPQAD